MLISIVIMPVGYLVAGPLSLSAGFTTTLVGAAIVGGVPAALTALVPGNRAVRRTRAGEIVGPAGEIIRQAVAAAADPAGPGRCRLAGPPSATRTPGRTMSTTHENCRQSCH
jgi:hypothetical protein